jgi:hypothetical protein
VDIGLPTHVVDEPSIPAIDPRSDRMHRNGHKKSGLTYTGEDG